MRPIYNTMFSIIFTPLLKVFIWITKKKNYIVLLLQIKNFTKIKNINKHHTLVAKLLQYKTFMFFFLSEKSITKRNSFN